MDQRDLNTLSVVIPSRNRRDVLLRALYYLNDGSILPDEVIIVDDASDTPIRAAIDSGRYRFPLNVIRFEKQRGAAGARNTGIRSAHNDLVLLMDDDIWPDHDMIYYHKLMHKKHPAPGYAVLGRVIFDPELKRTPLLHFLEEYGFYRWIAKLREGELYSTGILTANVSIKRRFLSGIDLFDENFPFNRNEDTEFGLRLMNHGFEPRFHSAPSARHHSPLTLEIFYNLLVQSGCSKAYWTDKKPDDTAFCLSLERLLRKTKEEKAFLSIYNSFMDDLGSEFFESCITECSSARFEEFRLFMQVAQGWVQDLSMISAWKETIVGFRQTAEDLLRGMCAKRKSDRLDCFRKGFARNADFFPAAVLLAGALKDAGRYEEARQTLTPFHHVIWAKLRLGELEYHLGRHKESRDLFMSVIDVTGHGKSVEQLQRKIAINWLKRLSSKTNASLAGLFRELRGGADKATIPGTKTIDGSDLFDMVDKSINPDYLIQDNLLSLGGIRRLRKEIETLDKEIHLQNRFSPFATKAIMNLERRLAPRLNKLKRILDRLG